jgi:hypothetical protein
MNMSRQYTKTKMSPRTATRLILLAGGIFALLIWGFGMSAAPPASPAVNLDQASNGGIGKAVVSPVGWENGNQNGQKAHYNEGESIPYRARVTGLTSGQTYRATYGYDITHGGAHAIDYITGRQRIAETVNPCQNGTTVDISPCAAGLSNSSGTASLIPAPTGGNTLKDIANGSFNSVVAIEGPQRISIFNGEVTQVAFVSEGDPSLSQSETTFSVTFTASSSTVVLSWGGHIARAFDWANNGGSATTISGSPFHTRVKTLEVGNGSGGFNAPISIGNQDRALASSAVQPPAACSLSNDGASICGSGTTRHEYPGAVDTSSTYTFSFVSGGATATIGATNTNPSAAGCTDGNTSTPCIYADVTASAGYTLRLTVSNAAGSKTCDATVAVDQPVTANAGTNQSFCETGGPTFTISGASATGPSGETFSWLVTSGPASVTSGGTTLTPTITFTGPGTATVRLRVTPPSGSSCSFVDSSVDITMADAPEAEAGVASRTQCETSGLAFTISGASAHVPTGGSFGWSLVSGTATITNENTLTPTITLSGVGSATARLTVSGPAGSSCGPVHDDVVLTVQDGPEADAGAPTREQCASDGLAFTISGASAHTPTDGSLSWSITSGTATITNGGTLTPTITLNGAGSVTARLTVSGPSGTTCANATDDVVLTVLPNPTVTISLEAECDAGLALLKANPSSTGPSGTNPANYTYQWSKDGNPLANETSQTLHVTALGLYSVTIRDNSAQTCPASAEINLCFKLQAVVAALPAREGLVASAVLGQVGRAVRLTSLLWLV